MKTWIKGGLIGGGISILTFFISFVLFLLKIDLGAYLMLGISYFPAIVYATISSNSHFNLFFNSWSFPAIFGLTLIIAFYFLIGTIIGLIVQKIKLH